MNVLHTTYQAHVVALDDFDSALKKWLKRAEAIIKGHHDRMKFTHTKPGILLIDPKGRKYLRIVKKEGFGSSYVYCFIEKATGNVLKADGWMKPHPTPRGNIWEVGKEGVSAYGALYLK